MISTERLVKCLVNSPVASMISIYSAQTSNIAFNDTELKNVMISIYMHSNVNRQKWSHSYGTLSAECKSIPKTTRNLLALEASVIWEWNKQPNRTFVPQQLPSIVVPCLVAPHRKYTDHNEMYMLSEEFKWNCQHYFVSSVQL